MRTFTMLAAAACLLAAPFASGAACSGKVSRAVLSDAAGLAGLALAPSNEVQGIHALSNGQRVRLLRQDEDVVAVFDQRQPVRLEEAGVNRYVSREGDIELSWRPRPQENTIELRYPADRQGRLMRACEG